MYLYQLRCRNKPKSIRLMLTDSVHRSTTDSEETKFKYDDEIVRIFNEFRSENYQDQIKLYRNLRKDEIFKIVDKIIEGKKRKLRNESYNKRCVRNINT